MSRHQPFNPKLVIALIAAGLAAFAALVLLLAFGSPLGAGRDGRGHAQSPAAVGFSGLVALVGRVREVHMVDDVAELSYPHLAVIVLEPQSRPEDLQAVLNRRDGLPTLIVLPKWSTLPLPGRPGWVQGGAPGAGGMVAGAIGEDVTVRVYSGWPTREATGTGPLAGLRFPVPESPQIIEGPNLRTIVPLDAPPDAASTETMPPRPNRGKPAGPTGPGKPPAGGAEAEGAEIVGTDATGGPALIAQIGDQPHYVLAEPDLLNNHGLADPATARAALALIDRLNPYEPDTVDFDLTVNGLGGSSQNMLRLAFEPPFLAMTLALLIAALLAGFHGAFRFGPVRRARRAIALGKAALVENSAGLIRLARREARLGGAYADVVRHEVARAVHAPPGLDPAGIDRHLDRIGPRDGPTFSELAANLAGARDRTALMAAARALTRWKKAVVK